jgi:glycosyltransferase involved in cell wall biosynthesis
MLTCLLDFNSPLPYNPNPMRITLLSKALVTGAYQRKCELIAAHPDVELTVCVPPVWRTGEHIAHLEHVHTRGYALVELPIHLNGNYHLHYYSQLAQQFQHAQPDIVHIDEEPYNLATFQALRAARALHARALFFSWQNLVRQYPPPFCWIERYVLANSQCAVAGSQEAAQVLRGKGFARQIDVIPQFGVDPDVFSPRTLASAQPRARFLIGYVGRLVKEKGVDLLLQALAGLPESVRVMIVGDGEELLNLRNLAMRLNVAGRVEFVPLVSSTRMPFIYAQLDALVLPSRTQVNWKEQFGRVLIEAMASGVPVIGSTCGEIPQVIGDAGLLFPEGDAMALSQQLCALIEQPTCCADLAQRGRARVLARYTMQSIADDTVAVYRRMMQDERD